MNLQKLVSKIHIVEEYISVIDYLYKNGILYFIYNKNDNLNLIFYNLNNFRILKQYHINFYKIGCFDKNYLYVIDKLNIYRYNLNTLKKTILYHNVMKKDDVIRKLFIINKKIYICYTNNSNIIIKDIKNNFEYLTPYENDRVYFYKDDNNIYIRTQNKIFTVNLELKTFSERRQQIYHNVVFRVSDSCDIVYNKLYDFSNNTITEFEYSEYDYLNNMYYNAPHESNKLINNIYFYNGEILIKTCGTINELNYNNENIKLINGLTYYDVPKNVLIKRSKFFRDMFNDCDSDCDNLLTIDSKYYDKLPIYLDYIKTNSIIFEDFQDLFEFCLFIEDVDVEHLANFLVYDLLVDNGDENSDYSDDESDESDNENNNLNNNLNNDVYIKDNKNSGNYKYFHYAELLYSNNLMKQYYQFIISFQYYSNSSGDELIEYLKNTKSLDHFKFYVDTLEYLVKYKYFFKDILIN